MSGVRGSSAGMRCTRHGMTRITRRQGEFVRNFVVMMFFMPSSRYFFKETTFLLNYT